MRRALSRLGVLRDQEQPAQNQAQVDVVICNTHLAAFWHFEHVFEALRASRILGDASDYLNLLRFVSGWFEKGPLNSLK